MSNSASLFSHDISLFSQSFGYFTSNPYSSFLQVCQSAVSSFIFSSGAPKYCQAKIPPTIIRAKRTVIKMYVFLFRFLKLIFFYSIKKSSLWQGRRSKSYQHLTNYGVWTLWRGCGILPLKGRVPGEKFFEKIKKRRNWR